MAEKEYLRRQPMSALGRDDRLGSIATEVGCPRYVRFTPESNRPADIAACLKGAKSGKREPIPACRFRARERMR